MAQFDVGSITRAQDFSIIKHNEDLKAFVDQTNIAHTIEKQTDHLTKEVTDTSESEWYRKRHDAKDKGNSEYAGDGGKNRDGKKEHKPEHEDKVVVKGRPSGFNISI